MHSLGKMNTKRTVEESVLSHVLPRSAGLAPEVQAVRAADILMDDLDNQEWSHDFGLKESSKAVGKMFGVLVVQNDDLYRTYLQGFSGKLGDSNHHHGFVPPVYDSLDDSAFLNEGMMQLQFLGQEIAEAHDERAKEVLKAKRKAHSQQLQLELFRSYRLLNQRGERSDLLQIFEERRGSLPPSAAGECAAPKLLHYAFSQGLKPLALAEFWWGAPTRGGHAHRSFHTPCWDKCGPILDYMLGEQGIKDLVVIAKS